MVQACIDHHLSMKVNLAREDIFNREDRNEKQTDSPPQIQFKPLFNMLVEFKKLRSIMGAMELSLSLH